MQRDRKIKLSILGHIFNYIDKYFCHNLREFIGRRERTVEIIFLIIFFLLQGILAILVQNRFVTILIIIFLFFLALERIFIHIWLEYKREKLSNTEKKSKEKYEELRFSAYHEINKLQKENLKEKYKILKDKR